MDYLVALFVISGVIFTFFAALGILKMPDAFIRMHSSTKAGTIGLGLIMIGVALHFQDVTVTSRAIAIVFFLLMTAPVAAHLLGKSLLESQYRMWRPDDKQDKSE